ncbi:unnamed protein product [Nippostrongylus brasiliensis]|uniref:Secreted protein n=1 Tax=Nippostrongylus brasiliensis TaxID=27835 RepID=A0A0N4XPD2_NIPBR|nr:unnamed protein product [Nippostrongylus brasiliensis]
MSIEPVVFLVDVIQFCLCLDNKGLVATRGENGSGALRRMRVTIVQGSTQSQVPDSEPHMTSYAFDSYFLVSRVAALSTLSIYSRPTSSHSTVDEFDVPS